MLYKFILNYVDIFSFLNVFKYLTVRTGLAIFTSLFVVFLIGTPFINFFSTMCVSFLLIDPPPSLSGWRLGIISLL